MKPFRIIILIAFVFVSIASLTVFISEKISTDKTIPEIKVEGELIEVSLKATDEELLKGVTAHDEKDGNLTSEIIVESISKFTEKGVSKVTYAVCDSNNNIAKATRKIKYKGYESPKFKVLDNLCFSIYESINIQGTIMATDCLEGNITPEAIVTSSDFSPSTVGAFSVDVTITNKKGDTSSIQLPLIVEDRPTSAPKIILKEYLVYTSIGKKIDYKNFITDALDQYENSLKKDVKIESNVNFDKEGIYQVHYYVTDSDELRGHSVLTVVVGD